MQWVADKHTSTPPPVGCRFSASRLFIEQRNAGNWVSFRRCLLMCDAAPLSISNLYFFCWSRRMTSICIGISFCLFFLSFHYSGAFVCALRSRIRVRLRWRSLNDNRPLTHTRPYYRVERWIFIRDVLSVISHRRRTPNRHEFVCASYVCMRKHSRRSCLLPATKQTIREKSCQMYDAGNHQIDMHMYG